MNLYSFLEKKMIARNKASLIQETTVANMHTQTESRPSNRIIAVFARIATLLPAILAFTMFSAINIAHAEEAGKTKVSEQGAPSSTKTRQEQSPDGWMPCSSSSSKQAYHDVTFNNCNGSYDLQITRGKYQCMQGAGNTSLTVPVGTAYQINLSDDNGWPTCTDTEKNVTWNIQAKGGPNYQAEWRHAKIGYSNQKTWSSEIQATATNGAGLPNNATCDGSNCLNQWATADTGRPQVIVYFQ
jgi:hypothetical protein